VVRGSVVPIIIISYLRSGALTPIRRVIDHLVAHYGQNRVFRDIRDVWSTIRSSDVVVAIIGPAVNPFDGSIGLEIATAMQNAIPILPVLIDGARMPNASDVPVGMTDFLYLDPVRLDSRVSEQDFAEQMDRTIIPEIDRLCAEKGKEGFRPAPAPLGPR
jgi:hypothetical protein